MFATIHSCVEATDCGEAPPREPAARQHSVYPWVSIAPGAERIEIAASDMACVHGVREDVFRDYIRSQMKEEADVKSLPWAMLSLILYALVLLTHETLHLNNSIEAAIEFDITANANFAFSAPQYMGHKNYNNVNSFADFWSWMTRGYVPLTMKSQHDVAEGSDVVIADGYSRRDAGRYLWHNLKLGPTRLSQESKAQVDCSNRGVAKAYGLTCRGSSVLDLDLPISESQVSLSPYQIDVAKTKWLINASQAQSALEQLQESRWLGPWTTHVQVSMLLYNADVDILILTHVNFLFAESGRIWKVITHNSINLSPYYLDWHALWDALFYAQVAWLLISEMRELCSEMRLNHPMLALRSYCGFWNVVDCTYVVVSLIALGLWVARVISIRNIASKVLQAPRADACTSDACQDFYSTLFVMLGDVHAFLVRAKTFAAVVPLVIMCRMFKAFAAQPRLALVTETLYRASSSLAHYLVVFFAICACFAVMSVGIFGRDSAKFSTLDRATPTLLRMMLGGFDFDDMSQSGRGFAFVFFVCFMSLITIVMLSMLIAIIMDVYIEVKAGSKSSETLLHEMSEILSRAWQDRRGTRLSFDRILRCLHIDGSNVVRVSSLLESGSEYFVPGLLEEQAFDLLSAAAASWAFRHTPAITADNIKELIIDAYRDLQPFCRVGLPQVSGLSSPSGGSAAGPKRPSQALLVAQQAELGALFEAAWLKLELGSVPRWPGAKAALQQLVDASSELTGELFCTSRV